MIKKLAVVFLAALLAGALIAGTVTVSASAVLQTVFSDDFSSSEIKEEWNAGGDVSLLVERNALQIRPSDYDWTGNVVFRSYSMQRECRIEFTVFTIQPGNWLAFAYGNDAATSPFPYADGALIFSSSVTQIFAHDGSSLNNAGLANPGFSPLSPVFSENGARVSVSFVRTEAENWSITYSVADAVTGVSAGSYTYTAESDGGYFSFNSNMTHADVCNLRIYENDVPVAEDNFADSAVSYTEMSDSSAAWVAGAAFSTGELYIAPVSKLDLRSNGSYLTFAEPFRSQNNDTDVLYRLEATFYPEEMDAGVAAGFEIGRREPDDAKTGIFYGFTKEETGLRALKINGALAERREKLTGVSLENGVRISLTVYRAGKAELAIADEKYVFENEKTDGYFSIICRDTFGADGYGALADDFVYSAAVLFESDAADAAVNFDGVRESELFGQTYYEYYLSSKEWYIGSSVSTGRYNSEQKDGYLQFIGSNVNSVFGPRQMYADFVVRFDAMMPGEAYGTEYNGQQFGLSFAKKTISENNDNATSLSLALYDGRTVVMGKNLSFSEGYNAFPAAGSDQFHLMRHDDAQSYYNVYQAEDTLYNFVFVVRGGYVSMYFKEADEPESVLGVLRARYYCGDTYGYMSVFGANGASFRINNFSVTNLSESAPVTAYAGGELQETARCDFAQGTPQGFSFAGAVENGAAQVTENSILATQGSAFGGILRLYLSRADGAPVIRIGTREIAFAADGSGAALRGFGDETNINFSRKLSFEGAVLEVYCMGGELEVSFRNAGEPLSILEKAEISVPAVPERAVWQLGAEDGTVAVEKICFYNLDSTATIAPRNFDPEKDVTQAWVVKPSLQGDGNTGLVIGLSVGGGVLAAAAAVVIVLAIRKKKGKQA